MNLSKIKKFVDDHKIDLIVGGVTIIGGILLAKLVTGTTHTYYEVIDYVPFSDMSKEEAIEMMKKAINNEVEMIDAQVYESDGQASLWFNLR
jgi:hypothetical protein